MGRGRGTGRDLRACRSSGVAPLEERFVANLLELGVGRAPARLLVAVSGGCDSVTLLFLLRFFANHLPLTLHVAHLDHAMRATSAGDAAWVSGLCRAWGVPLETRRLDAAPAGEEAARRVRYSFLRRTASKTAADYVLTAHHADDQAETVLFRALRGTGLEGLKGIPALSSSGLVRPLLPFWRDEIETFARRRGLRWRLDASNATTHPARNRLRLEILPAIERHVAPTARRNLVSLASLAAEAEDALGPGVERAERALLRIEDGAVLLARSALRKYDPAIGSRLLRKILRRFGVVLTGTGTRTALQFITNSASGRELRLPRGVRVRLEFDVARVERAAPIPPDRPLEIEHAAMGEGTAQIGGRRYRVEWRGGEPAGNARTAGRYGAVLPLDRLNFPLLVRGWKPGDRMRTSGGTKTLKKLFLEHRIPRSLRPRLPVVVDAAGVVVWVAGVPRRPAPLDAGEKPFLVTVLDD